MAKNISSKTRLYFALSAAALVALALVLVQAYKFIPLATWDTLGLIYMVTLWLTVWKMTPDQTKAHSSYEDPSRAQTSALLVVASVVSLVAVGFMITQATSSQGLEKAALVALALVSVFVSWAVVHTTFAMRYCDQYYTKPQGGIEFNESAAPCYSDFAYLAFTVGMTFQVSDTQILTMEIRKTILKHALLSYLFGAVIIATVINTIAGLGK